MFTTLAALLLAGQTFLYGQEYMFEFGEVIPLNQVLEDGSPAQTEPIKWYNVNTETDTWDHQDSDYT